MILFGLNKSLNNFINFIILKQLVEENIEDNENFDKIKVFSSKDEKLKILGELLSNKSSRDIIKLLIEKEMYTNEITKKLDLRVNLVIHHLRKMESIGLLEINNKKIIRKGEEHRFFKIPPGMLIVPNESEDIKKNGFLKKIFKNGIKFVSIISVGVFSWLSGNFIVNFQNSTTSSASISKPIIETISDSGIVPIIISQLIVILLTIYLIKKKKVKNLSL